MDMKNPEVPSEKMQTSAAEKAAAAQVKKGPEVTQQIVEEREDVHEKTRENLDKLLASIDVSELEKAA